MTRPPFTGAEHIPAMRRTMLDDLKREQTPAFVLVRSDAGDGGWSLHAPGSTAEQIADGTAPYLASGEASILPNNGEWSRPDGNDYAAAEVAYAARQTTHTPGPWKFRPVTDDAGKLTAMLLETTHRPVPCNDPCILAIREDWTGHLFRSAQGKANAHLIEAAPDLYAALDALLQWGRDHTSPRDADSPHELLIAAAKAITKATA